MADPKKKLDPEDPFDLAGSEDRAAEYFEKLMDGTAPDSDYWDVDED